MSRLQVAAVAITVGLNGLDGFDVLAISFASPGIASDWGIDRADFPRSWALRSPDCLAELRCCSPRSAFSAWQRSTWRNVRASWASGRRWALQPQRFCAWCFATRFVPSRLVVPLAWHSPWPSGQCSEVNCTASAPSTRSRLSPHRCCLRWSLSPRPWCPHVGRRALIQRLRSAMDRRRATRHAGRCSASRRSSHWPTALRTTGTVALRTRARRR